MIQKKDGKYTINYEPLLDLATVTIHGMLVPEVVHLAEGGDALRNARRGLRHRRREMHTMSNLTNAQKLHIRAELALRMGTHHWFTDDAETVPERWLGTRKGMATACRQYPAIHEATDESLPIYWPGCDMPDPFTSAADKDALVAWVAEDNARWSDFYQHIESALEIPEGETRDWRAMWLMTASHETITLAAARAVGH